jgi:peptide/nickel transport system ATP-binding protein
MVEDTLLSVRRLSVRVRKGRDVRTLVDSISFDIRPERVALVGESGSGKSVTARALLGLLRKPLEVHAERLQFDGRDLGALTPAEWAKERGASLALVVQDPRHALNPVLRVGRQLDETLRIHQRIGAGERQLRITGMLDAVGLSAARVLGLYPHQLSGGMAQRAMLAMMLINGPRLLIADEPTSALDAELRDQTLELMSALVDSRRMGLLLISHDLRQVARYCDRVLVMYRGRIVDARSAAELADSPHPYTRLLWSCKPSAATRGTLLPTAADWDAEPGDAEPGDAEK